MRFIFLLFSGLFCLAVQSQTAQKPSGMYNDEETKLKTQIPSLSVIKEREDFDKLSRVFNAGTLNEMPHILFIIDRNNKNKINYLNTPMYSFHLYFINEMLGRDYTPSDIANNYLDSTRRFILGTISYQKAIKSYVYEFWEGDKITPGLLSTAQKVITGSFAAGPIVFKTNSSLHENAANALSVKYVTQEQLVKESPYIALNAGNAKGRIRIAEDIDSLKDITEYDILVLKEVPIAIPVVAGIITERASTLLSHVNILARGLKIPSIYIKDAATVMKQYDGKFVELNATFNGYKIKAIATLPAIKAKANQYAVRSNKVMSNLLTLDNIRAKDHIYCGAKAGNLGEVKGKIKNLIVPDGFAIPFAQYYAFMKKNRFFERLNAMQSLPGFYQQPELRKNELEKLRHDIETANIDDAIADNWIKQWQTQLKGLGVFVRSSSNAEDLKNFSGAGLFSTIPNVKTDKDLVNAVKKVWASVFNYEAYENRRMAGISDSLILMSAFVQTAINSDISGVMITKDPYNPLRKDVTYIAAKRGIGIKVVEGKRIAEQVMYSGKTKAIQLISKSEEDTELRLDTSGGVKEVPVANQNRVMSDGLVVKLATAGEKIKQLFKGSMDIEWAVTGDQVIILQARPYK